MLTNQARKFKGSTDFQIMPPTLINSEHLYKIEKQMQTSRGAFIQIPQDTDEQSVHISIAYKYHQSLCQKFEREGGDYND